MCFGRSCDRHSIDLIEKISPIGKTLAAMRCRDRRRSLGIAITHANHFDAALCGQLRVIPGMMPSEASHADRGDLQNADCGLRIADFFHNIKSFKILYPFSANAV